VVLASEGKEEYSVIYNWKDMGSQTKISSGRNYSELISTNQNFRRNSLAEHFSLGLLLLF
jgi:hypothetical protein